MSLRHRPTLLRSSAPGRSCDGATLRKTAPVVWVDVGVSVPSSVSEDDGGGILDARVQLPILEEPLWLERLWVGV